MPFFTGAHNFTINGGTMNDVNGDQTINNNTTNNNNTNSNNKYETRIQDSYNDNSRNHIVQGNTYNTNAGAGTFNNVTGDQYNVPTNKKNGLPRRNMIRGRGGRGYPPPHQLAPHDSGYPFSPPLPQAPAFSTNAAFEQPVFKSNNPFNNAAGLPRAYSAVPQGTGSSYAGSDGRPPFPHNPHGPPNHYAPQNQYASQSTNHPRPQNPYSQYDGYNDEENDYEDGEQEVGTEVEGQDPYYGNHAQPNLEQPYAQNQTNWGHQGQTW